MSRAREILNIGRYPSPTNPPHKLGLWESLTYNALGQDKVDG